VFIVASSKGNAYSFNGDIRDSKATLTEIGFTDKDDFTNKGLELGMHFEDLRPLFFAFFTGVAVRRV